MWYEDPKLMDCRQPGAGSELFIVEGDSAARSVDLVRDVLRQAIFPMQGKPMNAMKVSRQGLLANRQFALLLEALGVDLPANEEAGSGTAGRAMRYQDVILMFDPDADGIHARSLMLLFFYRWLRPLLAAGRIFDAHAPRWEITATELAEPMYAVTPGHMRKVRAHLQERGATNIRARYFRGLGGVDSNILDRQCVNPKTRSLVALSVHDAEAALAVYEQMREIGRSAR